MSMNTGGWRDAPAKAVWLPAGTLIADPKRAKGCWGTVASGGTYAGQFQSSRCCQLRARPGKLTCRNHAKHEAAARAMQASTDPK